MTPTRERSPGLTTEQALAECLEQVGRKPTVVQSTLTLIRWIRREVMSAKSEPLRLDALIVILQNEDDRAAAVVAGTSHVDASYDLNPRGRTPNPGDDYPPNPGGYAG